MAQVSGAVKLTEKQPGTATMDSYVLVTQKELPSDYIITGDEEEGELDAMKVESVRRVPTEQMIGLVLESLGLSVVDGKLCITYEDGEEETT